MDVPTTSEEQKEPNKKVGEEEAQKAIATQSASAAVAVTASGGNAPSAGRRHPAGHAKVVSIDRYAEKRLARKKKMRATHRRRLKASHAKG